MGKNSEMATAIQKKEMINALEACYGNVTAAAKMVGITPRTHYNWAHEDGEYCAHTERMKDICFRKIKDVLLAHALKKVESGNITVLNKLLSIYMKNLPEEIDKASRQHNPGTRAIMKYIGSREEAQEIMKQRALLRDAERGVQGEV